MAIPKLAKGGVNLLRGGSEVAETTSAVSRVESQLAKYGDDIAELQSIVGDADTAGMIRNLRESGTPVGMSSKGSRSPIFADNDLLIAAEKGNANALAEIRSGDTYITSNQLNEFLNVNTASQRRSLKAFLKNENIEVFNGKQAQSIASSSDFQNVFKTVAKDQGRGDAALSAFAKATGYEAVTMERRLSNYLIYSRPKLGVPIRRLK